LGGEGEPSPSSTHSRNVCAGPRPSAISHSLYDQSVSVSGQQVGRPSPQRLRRRCGVRCQASRSRRSWRRVKQVGLWRQVDVRLWRHSNERRRSGASALLVETELVREQLHRSWRRGWWDRASRNTRRVRGLGSALRGLFRRRSHARTATAKWRSVRHLRNPADVRDVRGRSEGGGSCCNCRPRRPRDFHDLWARRCPRCRLNIHAICRSNRNRSGRDGGKWRSHSSIWSGATQLIADLKGRASERHKPKTVRVGKLRKFPLGAARSFPSRVLG
jgi:hypothetical protein